MSNRRPQEVAEGHSHMSWGGGVSYKKVNRLKGKGCTMAESGEESSGRTRKERSTEKVVKSKEKQLNRNIPDFQKDTLAWKKKDTLQRK